MTSPGVAATPWPPPVTDEATPPAPSYRRLLATVVVALAGPLAWTTMVDDPLVAGAWLVAVVGVALWATSRTPERWWAARWLIWIAAAAAALPLVDPGAASWLGFSLLLADWAIRGRRLLPGVPGGDPRLRAGPVVLQLVAAWRAFAPDFLVPAVLTLVSLAVTFVGARSPERVLRLNHRLGQVAGTVVRTVAFGLLGLALVVPAWLADRLLPPPWLRRRRAEPATTWVSRTDADPQPVELWSPGASVDPARSVPLGHRLLRLAAWPVAAVVLVTGVRAVEARLPRTEEREEDPYVDEVQAVAEDAEWMDALREEERWYLQVGLDPMRYRRQADLDGRYFNIRNGHRVTWTAPECECERVRLWLYGGSTTFGSGQRDHHTIASELARAAWEEGIALDVSNRGVSGDLHWMEAQRFALDALVEEPPDLVAFFDGWNDQAGSVYLNDLGLHDSDLPPVDYSLRVAYDALREANLTTVDPVNGPAGARIADPASDPLDTADEVAELVIDRYDTSREISRSVATVHGVPIFWFWQPTRNIRDNPANVPDEDAGGEAWGREVAERARDRLAPDVVDLTRAYDDVDEPIYLDGGHTGELGARIVAEEIWKVLRPHVIRKAGGIRKDGADR